MKFAIALTLVVLLGISGCSSQKKLVSEPPFAVDNPSCAPYAGGREISGSGFVLRLPLTIVGNETIEFKSVYFRGHILTPLLITEDGKQVLISRHESTVHGKPDMIMHADSRREVGNQPPAEKVGKKPFPFDLKPEEAVIAYRVKGKIKYVRITGIKDKMAKLLPTRQNN